MSSLKQNDTEKKYFSFEEKNESYSPSKNTCVGILTEF